MAAFRVGQRIKKVRGEKVGLTGTILELGEWAYWLRTPSNAKVTIDTPWVDDAGALWPSGEWAYVDLGEWEPICKDDDQVGSWDALEELGLDVDTIREAVYVSGAER